MTCILLFFFTCKSYICSLYFFNLKKIYFIYNFYQHFTIVINNSPFTIIYSISEFHPNIKAVFGAW